MQANRRPIFYTYPTRGERAPLPPVSYANGFQYPPKNWNMVSNSQTKSKNDI